MKIPAGARYAAVAVLGICAGAALMYRVQRDGEPPSSARGASALALPPPATALDLPHLTPLFASADPTERARILADDDSFAAFVDQEARNQSVLISAYAQAADQNEAVGSPGTELEFAL